MTEAEWQNCEDQNRVLDNAHYLPTRRRLLLFTIACCHSVWDWLDAATRVQVSAVEHEIDRGPSRSVLDVWIRDARDRVEIAVPVLSWHGLVRYYAAVVVHHAAEGNSIGHALSSAAEARQLSRDHPDDGVIDYVPDPAGYLVADPELASIVKCVLGFHLRPRALHVSWHTTPVQSLAEGIYADRAFDRLPILADALQDAGCDNADILDHCRRANEVHVRGCWVLDLILGKS
jgi:hypothetical protein